VDIQHIQFRVTYLWKLSISRGFVWICSDMSRYPYIPADAKFTDAYWTGQEYITRSFFKLAASTASVTCACSHLTLLTVLRNESLPACGDGIIQKPEMCDAGLAQVGCSSNCSAEADHGTDTFSTRLSILRRVGESDSRLQASLRLPTQLLQQQPWDSLLLLVGSLMCRKPALIAWSYLSKQYVLLLCHSWRQIVCDIKIFL
jgi:cysteine-rich repeat protein